jgi:hypothetical protein
MTDLIPFTKKCLLCEKSHLTEDEFIQCVGPNYDKGTWTQISAEQQLSESFIEMFQDKVDWWWISSYQQLSESFIEKFQDKVVIFCISKYHQLPKEFIEKVLIKLDNPKIQTKYYIEEYISKINNDISFAIERNLYPQEYKKHIMTILQEDKLNLTEEFKNELLMIILSEM